LKTVVEQHVSRSLRGSDRGVEYEDAVGIGMYRIDLHPSTGGDNYIDVASSPFQIPLGGLIPVGRSNLLAAGKNLGTTHITNACHRLHPVEWNVGEAAGPLAAHCLANASVPTDVHGNRRVLRAFQTELEADGVELSWPDSPDVGGTEMGAHTRRRHRPHRHHRRGPRVYRADWEAIVAAILEET